MRYRTLGRTGVQVGTLVLGDVETQSAGKIRHFGSSTFPAYRIVQALRRR